MFGNLENFTNYRRDAIVVSTHNCAWATAYIVYWVFQNLQTMRGIVVHAFYFSPLTLNLINLVSIMTPEERKNFIEALKIESSIVSPKDETIEEFLSLGFELSMPAKTKFIEEGSVNTNLYVQIDGLARMGYFDGKIEKTYGFSGPGTFSLSPRGFYKCGRAYFFVETCMPTKLMVFKRDQIFNLMQTNNEFCFWFSTLCLNQFHAIEAKLSVFTSSPSENYRRIMSGEAQRTFINLSSRPDIIKNVSSKVLASYLGISPSYLSNIRKVLLSNKKG